MTTDRVGVSRSPRRVGTGSIEIEPERAATAGGRLRTNLPRCRWLLVALTVAQLADEVTTRIALGSSRYVERNPLMSHMFGSGIGVLGFGIKAGAVLAVITVAMFRLAPKRAQVAVALALALALSLIGPVVNTVVLLRG